MKIKKPRSKKAVKPAARTVRGTRPKAAIRRLKAAATTAKKATKPKAVKAVKIPGAAKTGKPRKAASGPAAKTRAATRSRPSKSKVGPRTRPADTDFLVKVEPQVPLASASRSRKDRVPKLDESRFAAIVAREAQPPARVKSASALTPPPVETESMPEVEEESVPSVESATEPEDAIVSVPRKAQEVVIPPILFEGDVPASPSEMGPGQKYALGPTPPTTDPTTERAWLPASYGTGKLFLVPRDPHWLYAHWDLTDQQQRRYNGLSADRHLVVRIKPGTMRGHSSTEIHVHPESRHWFIHVDSAATNYTAELGYYPPNRKWVSVAKPVSAVTPPDSVSSDRTVRFATVSMEKPLRGSMRRAPTLHVPTVPTLEQARERILTSAISKYFEPRQSPSSADLLEIVGEVPEEKAPTKEIFLDVNSSATAQLPSSPLGKEIPQPRGFWLNVNAELVLYGATEPDATLLIDGYPVQLRPDGTFSHRFALPDGNYEVALWAMSADGELRQAVLKFQRASNYEGEVGAHPQDPALIPPPSPPPSGKQ